MFSQLLTIVTCLAMLWHSIGGCCWHHEHSDRGWETSLVTSNECHHPSGERPHFHDPHRHHDADEHEPLSPVPCDHSRRCTGETCVYLKSFSPDVTGMIGCRIEFVSPVQDLFSAQTFAALRTTDRVVLHREDLSALQHCALNQSWLL